MIWRLERFAYLPTATLGKLTLPSGADLYTIERPWKDNEPFVSCIPEGEYPLEWDTTGRVKNVPRLRDTGPRTQINIHAANYSAELHGCIAPGLSWNVSEQKAAVWESRAAMALLAEHYYPDGDGDELLDGVDGTEIVLYITSISADEK